jgi:hypothetical protein
LIALEAASKRKEKRFVYQKYRVLLIFLKINGVAHNPLRRRKFGGPPFRFSGAVISLKPARRTASGKLSAYCGPIFGAFQNCSSV